MMSIDVIHIHIEKERKYDKVKSNIIPETNDCLWTMHEN